VRRYFGSRAQVLPTNEIKDPELSALQARHMDDLKLLLQIAEGGAVR